MAKEIERKFLVTDYSYKDLASNARRIVQAYLSVDPKATVRIRIIGNQAYVTIKGLSDGCLRSEWEYEIPVEDAREIIGECGRNVVDKTRYYINRWEIDEFHGRHEGLVIAEIELDSPAEPFDKPAFIGREVTDDSRYYNSALSQTDSIPL